MDRGCLYRFKYIRLDQKRLASRRIPSPSSRPGMTFSLPIQAVAALVVATVVVMFRRLRSNRVVFTAPFQETVKTKSKTIHVEDDSYIRVFPDLSTVGILSRDEGEQMREDKELYWRLQNIEEHPCTSAVTRCHVEMADGNNSSKIYS